MGLTGKTKANTYKDLLEIDNSNSGVDATLRSIKTGDGTSMPIKVSKDKIVFQPTTADSTTAIEFKDYDGNSKFVFDSTNDLFTTLGHKVNTQYAYFGLNNNSSALSANTHYAIPFGSTDVSFATSIGTGTNPDTSYTVAITASGLLTDLWYLSNNITIDAVHFFVGADAATGDTIRCHLMSYDIDTSNSATGGDLSNGTVLADGADIVSAGYEQIYYQSMTIQSSNVNSGKAILFVFRQDGTNSDYTVRASIKYSLR